MTAPTKPAPKLELCTESKVYPFLAYLALVNSFGDELEIFMPIDLHHDAMSADMDECQKGLSRLKAKIEDSHTTFRVKIRGLQRRG